MEKREKSFIPLGILLIVMPLLCIFVTFFFGRYPLPPADVFQAIGAKFGWCAMPSNETMSVLWNLRFPRAFAGAFVGASLAASGAAFQGVFRNPLVNSGILGVSNGAGFGASLAILLFGISFNTYIFSFILGAVAVILSYFAGRIYKSTPTVTLILGGVVVSSFFASLTSIIKFMADPYTQLPAITFWLMGSLASISYKHFVAIIPMVVGMAIIFMARWKINVLSMGEKEAQTLGVNISLYKIIIIGGATLCTAAAVCISGVIGWVGLVIPHIGRMLVGNDNSRLIPVSMSMGACFVVLIDMLSRNISGSEIPIGILTSLIGTPFFVYLLKKTKGGGW